MTDDPAKPVDMRMQYSRLIHDIQAMDNRLSNLEDAPADHDTMQVKNILALQKVNDNLESSAKIIGKIDKIMICLAFSGGIALGATASHFLGR